MKLLLSSVFGPYGVDDKYGRRDNLMELLHNQVTREQGVFSPRFNNDSFGLHLIAENLEMPVTVLDFPSQRRFIAEVKKGYDYVGISFIVPNFKKAERMTELVRRYAPRSKIILGGHGTSLSDIDQLISCDHVCRGDGVAFMRKLLRLDEKAAVRHPVRTASFGRYVMGIPLDGKLDAGIVLPGVGCTNACRFCCTSHYFDRQYTPFLRTGAEIFDLCHEMEKKLGVTDFSVMDENFLKSEQRSRDLLALMERHGKPYSFSIFSSAEIVQRVGLEFLQRLGVEFLWMGVESKRDLFEKNRGTDFAGLIRDLRGQGINVLASAILFLEHHDRETIQQDIDFVVGLQADLVQFMQLGPMPGTRLFQEYETQGKLLPGIPWEDQHGQDRIWFHHPHFTREESREYLLGAFRQEYQANGPSILRMAETALRGAKTTAAARDPYLRIRHQKRLEAARRFYPLLDTMVRFAPGAAARAQAHTVREEFRRVFGKPGIGGRARSLLAQALMVKEQVRSRIVPGNLRQPATRVTRYN